MTNNLQAWLYDYNNYRGRNSTDNPFEWEYLGEAFVHDFVAGGWPELEEENDFEKALAMIVSHLLECRCYPNMPHKIIR